MKSKTTLTTYAEIAGILENLPMILREARRYRGVSQRAVGRDAGMSFSTVCRIEQGYDGSLSNAIAILRWLDTPDALADHPELFT